MIMVLVVDIGNTRIKCAVFENNNLLETFVFDSLVLQKKVLAILEKHTKISVLVIASVGKINFNAFDFLGSDIKIEWIDQFYNFPFTNNYKTPRTLGVDRMVLAAGAVLQFPKQNRLVIDTGTCITYDFINFKDEYIGGAISLGIGLRYKALNNYTAKLPLLEEKYPINYIGDSTDEALHSGVVNGVLFEIEGFLNRYESDYSNFTIILTGGDTVFLAKRLKNTIFANSNFLLESLNHTYQYKIKND